MRPRVDEAQQAEAFALLNDGERTIFSSMTLRDQQHCLAVYGQLRDEGHNDHDLLIAALLHDAGKGEVALWHRVAYVMLNATTPGLLDTVARTGDGPGWREALYRCRNHADLGAALASEAGSSDRVISLIREDCTDVDQQAALHTADEAV